MKWLVPSKEQIEYVRINSEYDFVKKSTQSFAKIEQQLADPTQQAAI